MNPWRWLAIVVALSLAIVLLITLFPRNNNGSFCTTTTPEVCRQVPAPAKS
jgi:hypothetical protein